MRNKISVIIPTYNVERFVEVAIRSIMQQTYSNLEIIIIDDCSTDNTFEILRRLAKEDDRIILQRNDKNEKIAETLNRALSLSTGRYIARMDGDDISHPERLKIMFDFLIKNPEYKLIGSNIDLIDEDGNFIKHEHLVQSHDSAVEAAKYSSPILHIWLTSREIYKIIGEYRMPGVEDYDFILRLITAGVKICNVPDFLYSVRIRKGNTISTLGLKQRKAFNYARRLYHMRIKYGDDGYSYQNFLKSIESNRLSLRAYDLSMKLYNTFMLNREDGFSCWFYFIGALILSPYYQIQYLYNRILFKRISK